MDLDKLFEQYLQHGKFLKNWSSKTPIVYRRAFTSFKQSLRPLEAPGEDNHELPGRVEPGRHAVALQENEGELHALERARERRS